MGKVKSVVVLLVVFLLASCASAPDHNYTPMEIQSFQSREYDESKDVVFASVMSVFQDIGYTVQSVDKDAGFITAESAAEGGFSFWTGATSTSQTKVTAFVETVGSVTRIRLNFVEINQRSGSYGQSARQDKPIMDAEIYRNAFEKIETAIFVRTSN